MGSNDLWDPFSRYKKRKGVDDLFPSLFDFRPERFAKPFKGMRQPLVDISDKGNEIEVVAELPGIDKDNVDVEVSGSSITIKAKHKSSSKQEDAKKGYFRQERSFSSFYRKLPLPAEVVPEKVDAEFRNGLLKVRLKKKHVSAKGKGKKINVK
jgi:HSP20 family protein